MSDNINSPYGLGGTVPIFPQTCVQPGEALHKFNVVADKGDAIRYCEHCGKSWFLVKRVLGPGDWRGHWQEIQE